MVKCESSGKQAQHIEVTKASLLWWVCWIYYHINWFLNMHMKFIGSPFQDKRQVAQYIFISPLLCWTNSFIWQSGRHAISWHSCSMSALCLWASMESSGPVSAERMTTSIQFMEKAKDMVVGGKSPVLCWCLRVFFANSFTPQTVARQLGGGLGFWPQMQLLSWPSHYGSVWLVDWEVITTCNVRMLACHLMKKHDDSCRTGTEPMRHNGERKPTSSGWLCRAEPVKATTNLLNSHLKPDFNRLPHH